MSLLSFGSLFGLPFLSYKHALFSIPIARTQAGPDNIRFLFLLCRRSYRGTSCAQHALSVFSQFASQPFTFPLCHMYSKCGRASQAVPSPTSSSQNLSPFLFRSFTPPPLAPETVPVLLSFYIHTHTHKLALAIVLQKTAFKKREHWYRNTRATFFP